MDMLGPLLFSYYRRRVLGLLLLHADASYHVREIARQTGTTAGTLHKELATLARAGILTRTKVGNQLHYSANRACPIFDELSGILRKTSGVAEVLAEALGALADKIEVAYVFGSVARGTESAASDIDVLAIGAAKLGPVIDALHATQKSLGREVNPRVFSANEWRAKLLAKDAFVTEVMAKSKLFLIGSEHELAELGRHQR